MSYFSKLNIYIQKIKKNILKIILVLVLVNNNGFLRNLIFLVLSWSKKSTMTISNIFRVNLSIFWALSSNFYAKKLSLLVKARVIVLISLSNFIKA